MISSITLRRAIPTNPSDAQPAVQLGAPEVAAAAAAAVVWVVRWVGQERCIR